MTGVNSEAPRDLPVGPASVREIGFHRRQRVRWLAPVQLVGTGLRSTLATTISTYLDRRESLPRPGAWPPPTGSPQHEFEQFLDRVTGSTDRACAEELWIDYVSDPGDGFDAAATVAHLIARSTLPVGGVTTTAGSILVMGGDQAYPTASGENYRDRLIGPYRAMLPWTHRPRLLFAVPGNHDWYDGLSSFLKVFCQRRWVGGWRTAQESSYFALRLTHRWHLWGIDIALSSDIDRGQIDYFTAKAAELEPNSSIILCTAKPAWTDTVDEPESIAALRFLEARIASTAGNGSRIRLSLTGDKHCYARYSRERAEPEAATHQPEHRLIVGGGGAYLSPTHHYAPRIDVVDTPGGREPTTRYALGRTYPDPDRSRRLRSRIFPEIYRNGRGTLGGFAPVLPVVIGAIYAVVAGLSVWLGQAEPSGPQFVLAVVVTMSATAVLGGSMFSLAGIGTRLPARTKIFAALPHSLAHAGLAVGVAIFCMARCPSDEWEEFGAVVGAFGVGGALGPLLFALYLNLADRAGVNANELFAGIASQQFKGFLRMCIDREGVLHLYPIGVDDPARWTFAPSAEGGRAWFAPDRELAVDAHLLEDEPIRLEPLGRRP